MTDLALCGLSRVPANAPVKMSMSHVAHLLRVPPQGQHACVARCSIS
jgi:hypothetical protein